MISNDEYSKLLDQQFETKTNISANKIISGTILKVNDKQVTVDIAKAWSIAMRTAIYVLSI